MSLIEETRFIRCPKECGTTVSSPHTICPTCEPVEHRAEVTRWIALAEDARPVAQDGYGFSLVAWLGGNRFVRVVDAQIFMRCNGSEKTEALIADAQRLRDENRELLIENARFRRALEKPANIEGGRKAGVLVHTCINTLPTDESGPTPCPACHWRSTGKWPGQ